MYGVYIEYGNGYRCSCCRQTWTGIEEFRTREEAIQRVAEVEFTRENYKRLHALNLCQTDDDDVCILSVFEFERIETDAEVASLKAAMLDDLEEKGAAKADADARLAEKAREAAEAARREQYEALKAEFEEVAE